jgi:hypothetical protein
MTTFNDLEHCGALPLRCEALTAIGWLGQGSTFESGVVDEEFFRKLCKLTAQPWQPVVCLGLHRCELCQFDPPAFSGNVFVPHQGTIYVAPVAIVHYIASHWYCPPQVFRDAVLGCPAMNSMEYKRALLSNGGRSLVTREDLRPEAAMRRRPSGAVCVAGDSSGCLSGRSNDRR